MSRRSRTLVRALAFMLVLALGVIAWVVATVVYPRSADPEAIPALTQPLYFTPDFDTRSIESTLTELAETFLGRSDSAGIAIGVVVDGERHTIARGVPSKSAALRPLDEDSLFEIASVTKVFTGIALAQAVLRGDIALDQRIDSLLPDAYVSPQLVERNITVGDLATHSSGLQRAPSAIPAWSPMFPGNPWSELTEADMVASVTKALEDPPVSLEYSYSGFGYMLLGRVLEAVSGRSYAELVERDISAPLGMTNTWVVLTDQARTRLVDGHRNGRTLEHHLDHTFPAAGGIASSLNDLLNLVEANIAPESSPIGEAIRLAITVQRPATGDADIALGWHVDSPEDATLIYHHGAMLGFWSYVGFSPQTGVGVVALANSRDPSISALGVQLLTALSNARSRRGVETPAAR